MIRTTRTIYALIIVFLATLIMMLLTLILSVRIVIPVALCILLYALVAPLLSNIRDSRTYLFVLPAPYIGSWFISVLFLMSLNIEYTRSIVMVSVIPTVMVTLIHIFQE